MKKMKIFAVLVLALLASSCASFGNEEQYEKGDWWGTASPATVARIKSDKLAFNKLAAEPVQGDAVQGYEGVAANFSRYRRNFYISGPETKSFLLGNRASLNWRENISLIPGVYSYTVMDGGKIIGTGMFRVGPERSTFLGEKTHWFVYTNE